jgi:hypothetical protein
MTGGAMEVDVLKPKLLATTGTKFSCSIAEFRAGSKGLENKGNDVEPLTQTPDEEGAMTNYFKSMQWYFLQPVLFGSPL